MTHPPCYQKLYSVYAKECQICDHFILCKTASVKEKETNNPVCLSILAMLRDNGTTSATALQRHLSRAFKGTKVNAYNWLSLLKKAGVITISNKGRKRAYALR